MKVKREKIERIRFTANYGKRMEPPVYAELVSSGERPIALTWYDDQYEPSTLGMSHNFAQAVIDTLTAALKEAKVKEPEQPE